MKPMRKMIWMSPMETRAVLRTSHPALLGLYCCCRRRQGSHQSATSPTLASAVFAAQTRTKSQPQAWGTVGWTWLGAACGQTLAVGYCDRSIAVSSTPIHVCILPALSLATEFAFPILCSICARQNELALTQKIFIAINHLTESCAQSLLLSCRSPI
jgi:hypothetical protein